MSEKLNKQCPICKGYLFSDDDIVYCPVCGAPHHRDCYNALGRCGCEEEHDKEQPAKTNQEHTDKNQCKYCSKEIPDDTRFCPYCGKIQLPEIDDEDRDFPELKFSIGKMQMPRLDPFGGLDKDSQIDGVKVKDLAKFISFAPNKLLPKWRQFQDKSRRFSWNWMAFIMPYVHTTFRKMGFATLMYVLLELTAFTLLAPFYYSIAYMDMPINSTALQLAQQFSADPLKYTSVDAIVLALLGVLLFVGYRVFAGLNNEHIYKKHAIATIKKFRADLDTDEEYAFYRKGGVRPFLSAVLFFLVFQFGNYIPLYIASLLFS